MTSKFVHISNEPGKSYPAFEICNVRFISMHLVNNLISFMIQLRFYSQKISENPCNLGNNVCRFFGNESYYRMKLIYIPCAFLLFPFSFFILIHLSPQIPSYINTPNSFTYTCPITGYFQLSFSNGKIYNLILYSVSFCSLSYRSSKDWIQC